MVTVGDIKQDSNIRILLYGPSGAGKTMLGLTLGKGLHVIDIDGNLISGATFDDQHHQHRRAATVLDCREPNPREPVSWAKAKSNLETIAEAGENWEGQALMIDSLTALCSSCMSYVQARDGWKSSGRGGPTQGQYGTFGVEMINFLMRMHSIPRIVILTAHDTEVWQDDVQGVKVYVPGKMLPPQIPIRFTEIWYLKPVKDEASPDDNPRYTRELITSPTSSIFCCSRLQVPSGTKVDSGLPAILNKCGIDFERRPLD